MRTIREAIDIYMAEAYRNQAPSEAVRTEADRIRALSDTPDRLFDDERLEHPAPDMVAFRLGNSLYPHMKLVMRRTPDGLIFGVDTHDGPDRIPPDLPGYERFQRIIRENGRIRDRIHRRLLEDLPSEELSGGNGAGRILVVDDEPFVGEIMTRLLAAMKFRVHVVDSADAALAAARRESFRCCFLDIMMPDKSGYELVEELEQACLKTFPIVFVTGMHPDSIRRDLADDVVLKPFTRGMLADALRRVGVV